MNRTKTAELIRALIGTIPPRLQEKRWPNLVKKANEMIIELEKSENKLTSEEFNGYLNRLDGAAYLSGFNTAAENSKSAERYADNAQEIKAWLNKWFTERIDE